MACSEFSQRAVFWLLQVGILLQKPDGSLTGGLQKVGIKSRVGNLQVESHTTLLCTVYIARTTQLHIKLCESETVGGLTHSLQTLASLS